VELEIVAASILGLDDGYILAAITRVGGGSRDRSRDRRGGGLGGLGGSGRDCGDGGGGVGDLVALARSKGRGGEEEGGHDLETHFVSEEELEVENSTAKVKRDWRRVVRDEVEKMRSDDWCLVIV